MAFMRAARHIGKIVLTVPPFRTGRLRADRTYLVTGGLGGIGCALAGWLAERGAGCVVLNGRRAPDAAAAEAIDALRARGLSIEVEIADVTDAAALDAMLERMDGTLPPLSGVIHSVGVLADAALGNQSWESFETVLWPKMLGAWHLHRATADRDLDMFVLFSSIAGVLGNPGQANHAAANAFLDQLSAHRRALGLPGQAIAWGAWSGLGEAEEQRERIARRRQASGTGWFTPEQGFRALDRLLRQDAASAAVLSADWSAFGEAAESRQPMFEDLLAVAHTPDADAVSLDDVLSRLAAAPAGAREELLVSFLQREVQAVLRLPSTPAPTTGFFDLGMDSLMAVEFREPPEPDVFRHLCRTEHAGVRSSEHFRSRRSPGGGAGRRGRDTGNAGNAQTGPAAAGTARRRRHRHRRHGLSLPQARRTLSPIGASSKRAATR